MTEDEMVEWHRRLDGHEFEYILGVGDGRAAVHATGKRHDLATEQEIKCKKEDLRLTNHV